MANENNSLPLNSILQGKAYKYKIEKVLGQGSFGITYLATVKMSGALGSIDANIKVAIKEFFMRDINGRVDSTVTSGSKGGLYDDYKKKFIREALNLSKLRHPNIIKVIESFEANNTVYFVMEYIGGGSLDNYISKKNCLQEEEAIRITKEVGTALSFMHSKGMLHLDLKPGNIMLKPSGEVVLIDFGLSKQYDADGEPESSTKVGAGTPGYAPIEQANYREGKGFPVTMDVYALGATMFKMLTGRRPPEASDILNEGFPMQELQQHHVSDSVAAVIAKAMAPIRKDRYDSVRTFMNALGFDSPMADDESTAALDDESTSLLDNEDTALLNKEPMAPSIEPTRQTFDEPVAVPGSVIPPVPSSEPAHIPTPQPPTIPSGISYRWGIALVALVVEILFACLMLGQSRDGRMDSDGVVITEIFISLTIAVVFYLIAMHKKIPAKIWTLITVVSTVASIANSFLLPIWNGSLTMSYFILSMGLALVSAITLLVKKK